MRPDKFSAREFRPHLIDAREQYVPNACCGTTRESSWTVSLAMNPDAPGTDWYGPYSHDTVQRTRSIGKVHRKSGVVVVDGDESGGVVVERIPG